MRLIFLDIDGVLNCQLFYNQKTTKQLTEDGELRNLCTERIGWLNELCDDVNAKVVISSTWRMNGIEKCTELLRKAGATFDIVGVTPFFRSNASVRGNEILEYIQDNEDVLGRSSDYHDYVIIDDDSDMLLWQKDHFFQTDNYSGLTPNTCYKIKRFFNRNTTKDYGTRNL